MASCMNLFKSLEERTLESLSEDSLWDQPELQAFFFSILFCVFIFGFPQFIWLISSILANKTEIAFWYFLLAFINCSGPKDLKRKKGRVGWKGWESAIWMTFSECFIRFHEAQRKLESLRSEKGSCWCSHTLSLCPPKPLPVPTLLPNPRFSTSTLPFRCPEEEDMSQHQTWKCELPLSPQNVIISENLGHRATEKVTLPTFFCSVARHLLPLSESSFSWGWTLTLKKKKIYIYIYIGRSGQKPAGTATTQVQLAEQLLQRTPTAYHFKHLVLGRVHVRVRPGIKKKKKEKTVSLTPDLRSKNEFSLWFFQKRKYIWIPYRYLVKIPKHTLRPMLFGREPTSLMCFCSVNFLLVSTSRFLLCAGKATSVKCLLPSQTVFFVLALGEKANSLTQWVVQTLSWIRQLWGENLLRLKIQPVQD